MEIQKSLSLIFGSPKTSQVDNLSTSSSVPSQAQKELAQVETLDFKINNPGDMNQVKRVVRALQLIEGQIPYSVVSSALEENRGYAPIRSSQVAPVGRVRGSLINTAQIAENRVGIIEEKMVDGNLLEAPKVDVGENKVTIVVPPAEGKYRSTTLINIEGPDQLPQLSVANLENNPILVDPNFPQIPVMEEKKAT